MNTQPHGVALVSCGVIGRVHIAALEAIDEVEVVAVVDVIEERGNQYAEDAVGRTGKRPPAYASLEEALAYPRVIAGDRDRMRAAHISETSAMPVSFDDVRDGK